MEEGSCGNLWVEDEYLEIFLVQLPLVELLAAATLPLPAEGK